MPRERKKQQIGQELDMKPFVNFMIILASALIICVEFSKIVFIDLKLPEGRGSNVKNAQTERSLEDKSDKLLLTAIVTDSVVTLGAKGGFMPSLYYHEFHRYVDKVDGVEVNVQYKPGEAVKNPNTGRELTIYERLDIFLYVVEDGKIIDAMYTDKGELVSDAAGAPLRSVNAGDTVYTVTTPRRMIVVKNPGQFQSKHLSAYDELKNRLMKVKERYPDAEDANDIIVAAENEVMYDKIIQLMDTAHESGYTNISIAKLRA
jgi:Biopolymer transport protein ExbD/TolR.